ncbi:glycerol-3-phosphate cytidylyltransferase [Limnohabitans sp. Hippo3]|uniref:glycerol-3-phosphate cytidylyltransferase n=1 Tax=Limnohabitans sp. Hippo3 TaxID=1597956 RepID=UPI000D3A6CC3|nr:glycerol-3-phosphate cytidylyltransferase [Limnohabitans sp. Hippo3]PUE44041.1 glycerol-3-phosphate cytidylyltransferase [Limnohabitans sp. Hippo3]
MTATHERIVLTYGTFDLFHPGHVQLLKRARDLGSRLVVGLSTDEFNAKKGKQSVMRYEDRKTVLESCRYVDEIFAEEDWSQKLNDARRLGADVFVMGDDWTGKFDFMQEACNVVYLARTEGVSTTEIKASVQGLNRHPVAQAAMQLI